MLLRDYLARKEEEQHSLSRYVSPLIVFHLVYWFGLYWSFVAFAFHLVPDHDSTWTDSEKAALGIGMFGGAGFMGAVLIVLWHLFWRAMRNDVQPRAYLHFGARLIVAPFLGTVLAPLLVPITREGAQFLAFGAGMFADSALRLIEDRWRAAARSSPGKRSSLPLSQIEGIGRNDELRLWEEGITDAHHLAVARIENLLVETPYSLDRLIDWKDQAFLYVYVGEDLLIWRGLYVRGILDVLGLEARYFGTQRHDVIRKAIAATLHKDEGVIERFIDTVYQDPRVHELWNYLSSAHPTSVARPITEPLPPTGSAAIA